MDALSVRMAEWWAVAMCVWCFYVFVSFVSSILVMNSDGEESDVDARARKRGNPFTQPQR